MAKIEDYRLPNGCINWASYQKAQIADGDICSRCHQYIVSIAHTKGEQLCYSCSHLDLDKSESVDHSKFARCPKCGYLSDLSQWDGCASFVYQEGEHLVGCNECDYDFEISTTVEYTFTSPPMITEPEEENG